MRKDLLSISDLDSGDIHSLILDAVDLKDRVWFSWLSNMVLAIMFEKPSLRTRVSFEVAMRQLGGETIYISPAEVGLGKRESVADVARVLSRYVDAIAARTFSHQTLEVMADCSRVPVINALSDVEHPCQALGDMQTVIEHGKEKGKLVYIGDSANNVANSLMLVAARYGMHVVLCSPEHFPPKSEYVEAAKKTGATVEVEHDPKKAVEGADVIYTDVWVSMGMEGEIEERMKQFAPYQVNGELLKLAKPDCIVLHCLPAHRGTEITDDVLDGEQAKSVWDQAENRMLAQEALLLKLLKK